MPGCLTSSVWCLKLSNQGCPCPDEKEVHFPLAPYLSVSRERTPNSALPPWGGRTSQPGQWQLRRGACCTADMVLEPVVAASSGCGGGEDLKRFRLLLAASSSQGLAHEWNTASSTPSTSCLQWLLSLDAEAAYGIWLPKHHQPKKVSLGCAFISGLHHNFWCRSYCGLSQGWATTELDSITVRSLYRHSRHHFTSVQA